MILQNGKRIDGCSDTVPVGTLQPYLGLVPPKGYLLCQGQLVSKTTYSKLYEICGNLFGEGTDTEFRLPDLRGKTIVGFDEGDTLLNVIGEILGSKTHTHTSAEHSHTIEGHTHTSAAHTHSVEGHTHTSAAHTHTTGNHTLTVAEIPAHSHAVYGGANVQSSGGSEGLESFGSKYSSFRAIEQGTYNTGGSGAHNHGNTGSTTPGNTGSTSLTTNSTTPGDTGSTTLTTNNTKPGDTGEADNYQPSIVMNWIVKAVMLIPEYFVVENTLNSDSEDNALSAKQGKLLNEKFTDYATKSEMIQYLPLNGGTMHGELVIGQYDGYGIQLGTNGRINATINNDTRCTVLGMMDDKVVVGHNDMPLWMRGNDSAPLYNGTLLVESGSNDKGNWVKFIDGTMICTRAVPINGVAVDNPWGDALYYYENNDIYDFPQAFIDTPYNFQMTFRPSTAAGGWLGNYSTSSITNTGFKHFAILRPTVNTIYGHVYVTAVGRWK
jgi:microcystin-dependent protein